MRRVDTDNRTEMEKIVDDDDDVEIVGRRNTERQRAEAEPDEEFQRKLLLSEDPNNKRNVSSTIHFNQSMRVGPNQDMADIDQISDV